MRTNRCQYNWILCEHIVVNIIKFYANTSLSKQKNLMHKWKVGLAIKTCLNIHFLHKKMLVPSQESCYPFVWCVWAFDFAISSLLYKLWISNILATSITEETCIVEMRIWCKKIGTVNFIGKGLSVLIYPQSSFFTCFYVLQ